MFLNKSCIESLPYKGTSLPTYISPCVRNIPRPCAQTHESFVFILNLYIPVDKSYAIKFNTEDDNSTFYKLLKLVCTPLFEFTLYCCPQILIKFLIFLSIIVMDINICYKP